MNFIDPVLPQQREARIRFLDAEFQIVKSGEFVRCGITGDPIRIDNLRYWNVDKQIAYKNAEISFKDLLVLVENQLRP
jgi:hypothetical protein